MRIAIISDIHGNWTALEAVLVDIRKRGVDQIICAGDYIDPMPSSRRVHDFLMNEKIVSLRGNHEDYVINSFEDPAHIVNTSIQFRAVKVSASLFDAKSIAELKALPFTYSISNKKAGDLLVCHASPISNQRGWRYEILPEVERSLLDSEESTIVCGHWHDPETRIWKNKKLVTAGSVGVPLAGNLAAEYVLLEAAEAEWHVEHLTVRYDPRATIDEYLQSGFVRSGGPVGWLLFYEVVTAKRMISPFLRWLDSRGPRPEKDSEWETFAREYLESIGAWSEVENYLNRSA